MRFTQGLSAFPITPMNDAGKVDTAALTRLVTPLVAAEVDSIGLLGSTGSYPFLARDERRRAMEAALTVAGDKVPVLVGIGALRLDDVVALARDAKAAGASAGLLAAVSYTPLTADEVFALFETVAGESGLPLVIYDNFATTHFTFTPELIGRIARIPGVATLKGTAPDADTVADHLKQRRAAVPAGFPIGYAGDWNVTEALLAGGEAWYSVAAGLFPQRCLTLTRAALAGNAAEARKLNAEMQPLWDLFKQYSSLRVVYASANIMGITDAQPPKPVLPLPADVREKVATVLAQLKLS